MTSTPRKWVTLRGGSGQTMFYHLLRRVLPWAVCTSWRSGLHSTVVGILLGYLFYCGAQWTEAPGGRLRARREEEETSVGRATFLVGMVRLGFPGREEVSLQKSLEHQRRRPASTARHGKEDLASRPKIVPWNSAASSWVLPYNLRKGEWGMDRMSWEKPLILRMNLHCVHFHILSFCWAFSVFSFFLLTPTLWGISWFSVLPGRRYYFKGPPNVEQEKKTHLMGGLWI